VTTLDPAAIEVRPLETGAEIDAFFSMAAATFPDYHRMHCTPTPDGRLANGWRRFNEEAPSFEPDHLRGAFVNGTLAGGYIHDERWLRLGDAHLRTGYVGGVVTDPARRGVGIASALMRDGIAHASARCQTLLVLRGIAGFYVRFGYADVMEVTEHVVERQRVLALPAPNVRVRPSSIHDSAALLELYERHYYPFVGCYTRTPEQQQHLLRHRSRLPHVAVEQDNRPCGYLLLPCGSDPSLAIEVAADSWPAALALLQFHADAAASASELRWPLPFGSPTYYYLADSLPLTSRTTSRPNAGWLARAANVSTLFAYLLPVLQERWRRAKTNSDGPLIFDVEGTRWRVELSSSGLRSVDESRDDAPVVRLTPGGLAQLVFGYRPATWVAKRAEQTVPCEMVPTLATLFPTTTAWYAGSNRC
jgi:GNAT superfamily N-acetyltransferase